MSTIKKSEFEEVIKEIVRGILKEMTTTGNIAGYNIPAAFSKRGGSKKGVNVSNKLGYDLTSIGKKDMDRSSDEIE